MIALSIGAQTAREALVETADHVMRMGREVRPRGKLTKELRHFTVCVEDPTDWACDGINANWSPMVAAVEGVQLVGGFSNPHFVLERLPAFKPFLNAKTHQFDGAYGPRAGDVISSVVARLRADHDSRQAIIPIYDAGDALRDSSTDYPCTLSLQFFIRDGQLDLDVTMRSNDVNWGLKHDMSQFMLLQCSIANALNIPVGRYFHTSNSMHLYAESFEWAYGLRQSGFVTGTVPKGGLGFPAVSTVELRARASDIAFSARLPAGFTELEVWLNETLHP